MKDIILSLKHKIIELEDSKKDNLVNDRTVSINVIKKVEEIKKTTNDILEFTLENISIISFFTISILLIYFHNILIAFFENKYNYFIVVVDIFIFISLLISLISLIIKPINNQTLKDFSDKLKDFFKTKKIIFSISILLILGIITYIIDNFEFYESYNFIMKISFYILHIIFLSLPIVITFLYIVFKITDSSHEVGKILITELFSLVALMAIYIGLLVNGGYDYIYNNKEKINKLYKNFNIKLKEDNQELLYKTKELEKFLFEDNEFLKFEVNCTIKFENGHANLDNLKNKICFYENNNTKNLEDFIKEDIDKNIKYVIKVVGFSNSYPVEDLKTENTYKNNVELAQARALHTKKFISELINNKASIKYFTDYYIDEGNKKKPFATIKIYSYK